MSSMPKHPLSVLHVHGGPPSRVVTFLLSSGSPLSNECEVVGSNSGNSQSCHLHPTMSSLASSTSISLLLSFSISSGGVFTSGSPNDEGECSSQVSFSLNVILLNYCSNSPLFVLGRGIYTCLCGLCLGQSLGL